MRSADLIPGVEYAIKAGPNSKSCYRAMVVEPVCTLGGDKGVGVAVPPRRHGAASFNEAWTSDVVGPALIVQPWADYLAKLQADSLKRRVNAEVAEARQEEIRQQINVVEAKALSIGFDLQLGSSVDMGRCRVNFEVLQRLVDAAVTPTSITCHQFELRPGCVVVLNLPTDLTKAEAERLAAAVKTFPFQS